MISYMHVISKNPNFVIAEVEMIWLEESQKKDYITSNVKKTLVPMNKFVGMANSVQEGDVFSVIHNEGRIVRVIEKDIEATKKRAVLKTAVVVA